MAQKDVGNKVPIYKLKKTEEVMKYYDEWGEDNKYDQDMIDWNYTGPKESSEVFVKYQKNLSSEDGIQVEINGDLFNCSIIKEPLYDPSGEKMRG